ncbi:SDR family NAD(P)-dependent oxidoreductase [Nocardia callitridis]|uniref:Type I polyketide synthase n=1 Tax=Nocardia callitridis TaxID=648753 RepID=A0ABP9JYF5_9NOCA
MTGPDTTPTPSSLPPTSAPAVAIVGMGCRLPGANGLEEFWRLLLAGRDATATPPQGRVGSRRGGYLDDIESFDNEWFAVSDRETATMDPQQRLALEVAIEAIDDAGIGYRAKGCGAAVVFGACGYDHGITVLGSPGHDAPYAVTGSALSIIANRLSYVLDLHGPSLVVDSACSSSLAALDYAVRLLADETVPFAIVGGVNLTLLPHTSDYLAEGGFLAPDGRCKPFDADADGYTRGEGCGVVILQRTNDAVRTGSRVYAEILGTSVGSDGRSNGLYAPNGRAQQSTLRTAWARAGLDPSTAHYIECHGTGTPLGDAVEVAALAEALRGARTEPIALGSVKSNIGHLEAAAGVTGLIKTALSLQRGVLPPTINFHTESPLLKLAERGLAVPTEPVDLRSIPVHARRAGVSSFGFGGTNAHVALRGFRTRELSDESSPVLIAVTGRDESQLRAQALRFAQRLDQAATVVPDVPACARTEPAPPTVPITRETPSERPTEGFDIVAAPDLAAFASATARLLPETHRAALVVSDRATAVARLSALAQGDSSAALIGPVNGRRRGRLLFLFSGQGGQHPRMGRGLAARYPEFAGALADAADAIAAAGGPRVWTPKHGFTRALTAGDNGVAATDLVQPATFAFQYALARLLATWGVHPDAVVGHSLGEIAAASVSGALSLGDAARVAVHRSRCLATLDGHGAMAVVEATPEEANSLVEPMRTEVAVAAINGPRSIVVSGTTRYVDTLVRRAKRRNLFATRIAVDFAAHSPQVADVVATFLESLGPIAARTPHTPVYSTTICGAVITDARMDHRYWADNASSTVELGAAIARAADDGLSTVLEIAPHPVLTPAVREHPAFRAGTHAVVEREDEVAALLTCLGQLYTEGRPVDWSAQGPFSTPPRRQWRTRIFPLRTEDESTHRAVDQAESGFVTDDLDDHVVHGEAIVPAVFWLRRLLHLARHRTRRATITDLVVHERTDTTLLSEVAYHGHDGGLRAEISREQPVTLASAHTGNEPTTADIVAMIRVVDANRAARHRMRVIPTASFYDELRARLLQYGPRFRVLRGIAAGADRALGLLDSAELSRTATLDGCLHVLAAAAYDELPDHTLPLPIAIDHAWLSTEPNRVVVEAHAVIRERTAAGLIGDVVGTDQHGAPCLSISGVHIRYVQADSLARTTTLPLGAEHRIEPEVLRDTAEHNVFHAERWEPLPVGAVAIPASGVSTHSQRVLVVGESALAVALARATDATVPTERVAREPDSANAIVAAVLAARPSTAHVAVVLVWPDQNGVRETGRAPGEPGPFEHRNGVATSVGHVLELLQLLYAEDSVASLTVVLPEQAGLQANTEHPAAVPLALAGLVRSLQLESGRAIRLVWADTDPRNLPTLAQLITTDLGARIDADPGGPEELRLTAGTVATRRFRLARPRATPDVSVDAAGTYVVTGGLGALGAIAVRWLLDAGARDVVVLTRAPRPVPALLDGLEHRIVVVRCDCADRGDLTNALNDIRECGSTIRGIVHAAGTLEDAPFEAVTPDQIAGMFAAKLTAASNLIELSAADPTDFVLLFSSATGAIGAPGQAAYSAANAAMDALARSTPRRVLSVGWGVWDTGLAQAAGGAAHIRRAGIAAFDTGRGALLLSRLLRFDGSYVLALDHTPSTDTSPLSTRLTTLLVDNAVSRPASPQPASPQPAAPQPAAPQPKSAAPTTTSPVRESAPATRTEPEESLTVTIRRVLARTLDLPAEHIGPTADFNELGLSSLLAIELRRNLESRLRVRISTAELFQHPTITALGAALIDRVTNSRNPTLHTEPATHAPEPGT